MSFFDSEIKLPAETNRSHLLLAFAVLSGLIPETGSDVTGVPVYCVIPPVLGGVIAAYWMRTSLGPKILLSLAVSCCSFVLRSFTTWVIVGFNAFGHLLTGGWVSRRAFFVLLTVQLLVPLFTLTPLHFLLPLAEKRKVKSA